VCTLPSEKVSEFKRESCRKRASLKSISSAQMIDCIVQDLLKYPDEGAESKVTVKQLVPGPNKDYRWVKQLVP
jgi:hypothetical protein